MTKAHTIEIESITFFLLAALIGIVYAFYYNHNPRTNTIFSLPVMDSFATPSPTPPPVPKTESFAGISPDGTKKITMVVTSNKTTSKTYTFMVSGPNNTNSQTIYSINLPIDESMSIPFNAFSPDDAFVFVQHNTRSGSEAFVFRTNGNPMTDTQEYYNAAAIFFAKQTGNTYQETTGWASETLLVINTTQTDGSKGPSYWLEVPSKAIIQLSTEF